MTDWRRYSGTQRLQLLWSVVAVVVLFGVLTLVTTDSSLLLIGLISGAWLAGLLVLAYRDRVHWNRMVEQSGFEHERGTRPADLERMYQNRSVFVTTLLPSLFAQAHTEITTRVEGVDVRFTVTLEYGARTRTGSADRSQHAVNEVDDRFGIDGSEQNIEQIMSPTVTDALLAIETPGTMRISGNEVAYHVPFTRLTGSELDTIADAVVTTADRVEQVARQT